ncbi:MAG TPA: APC family permease [Acidimicrobiia bacterium]|nr:APC family permease [Acidimicrobiia bacterium]
MATTFTRKKADEGPKPLPPAPKTELPETLRYRVKNRLLGRPLPTDALEHERLGIPTALAVFASDNLSSSAYATEEILRVLIPVVGLAAFSLVVPITTAMLVVLFFLILSYRETIKEYPTAGGAYMVTRDNFGLLPAQVAGVSLLTDYVLTVAVSVAAGTAALTSAVDSLAPYSVEISVAFIILIAFGNLKGVRESGRIFAIPTYFFIGIMAILLVVGFYKLGAGELVAQHLHKKGMLKFGGAGDGIFYGASLYVILHAFASGGAAVTGVEAISNGVTAFKKPEWKNARVTLVIMGSTLGAMFLGLSILSTKVHAVPYAEGTPTVISQIGEFIFGGSSIGKALYYALQGGTMLILVLAANTSFADFPRLASFHAGDNFMPKQLTKRGHRLVFSNGIIALAVAAIVLVIATGAKVDRLIPLYAIGVFTSFTLSQAGMARHHITRKEPGWRRGLFVNGTGAVMSAIVDIIIAITKFTHGAWIIVVLVPIMVYGLVRLNRQYESEAHELERDAEAACTQPILRRHVVLVFVARLDQSTARAIQYARALMPDEMRAVHIALDRHAAEELADEWRRLGLSRVPLELVDCPDRRVARAALEVVAAETADGQTEVSVLLPHRLYRRFWHRLLHDNTGDEIAGVVSQLPHANVTMVPYHLGTSPVPTLETPVV